MMSKKDFDHAAVTWDEKPGRIKIAADVANAIMKSVEVRADNDVLFLQRKALSIFCV